MFPKIWKVQKIASSLIYRKEQKQYNNLKKYQL